MTSEMGVFWLPDQPDNRLPGHLTLPEQGSPILELHGAFTPVMDSDAGATTLLVYGFLEKVPRLVTLVDCMAVGGTEVFGGLVPLEVQRLMVRNVLRGTHTTGPSQTFTAVRVRLGDIDAWASLSPFATQISAEDRAIISVQAQHRLSAETSKGAKISLIESIGTSWESLSEGQITRTAWIQAESFGDLTLRQIDRAYASPIASYLSLAVGANSPLTAMQVKLEDRWLAVRHSNMRAEAGPRVLEHDVLLPLHVADLRVLSEFLDVYEKVGPAAPVIADLLRNGRNANLETQVLELTTLAEGVHRNLFPEDVRMSEEAADRLRALVADAVVEEEVRHRQIVEGSISRLEEANYKQRLRRLVDEVEAAMPGVCGRANRWVNSVYEARNSFAHRNQGFLEPEHIDEFYAVSQSLRWVLQGLLLLQSGVTAETLSGRVRANQQYGFFLQNMRSSLPYVYGD